MRVAKAKVATVVKGNMGKVSDKIKIIYEKTKKANGAKKQKLKKKLKKLLTRYQKLKKKMPKLSKVENDFEKMKKAFMKKFVKLKKKVVVLQKEVDERVPRKSLSKLKAHFEKIIAALKRKLKHHNGKGLQDKLNKITKRLEERLRRLSKKNRKLKVKKHKKPKEYQLDSYELPEPFEFKGMYVYIVPRDYPTEGLREWRCKAVAKMTTGKRTVKRWCYADDLLGKILIKQRKTKNYEKAVKYRKEESRIVSVDYLPPKSDDKEDKDDKDDEPKPKPKLSHALHALHKVAADIKKKIIQLESSFHLSQLC